MPRAGAVGGRALQGLGADGPAPTPCAAYGSAARGMLPSVAGGAPAAALGSLKKPGSQRWVLARAALA